MGFPLLFPAPLTISLTALAIYALVRVIIGALFLVSAALAVSGIAGIIALFIPVLYMAKTYAKATPLIWNKLIDRKAGF